MIASLALRAFGLVAPKCLTGPIKLLIDIGAALVLLFGIYELIYHKGQRAGAAKVTAKVEKAHQAAVVAAAVDTKAAQVTTDQIGAATTRTNAEVTALVQSKIQEMHDALNAIPPAAAGA